MSKKDTDDIEKMLGQIVEEKNKLEKLTKKISERTSSKAKTLKAPTNAKLEVESPNQPNAKQPNENQPNSNNQITTDLQTFKIELEG